MKSVWVCAFCRKGDNYDSRNRCRSCGNLRLELPDEAEEREARKRARSGFQRRHPDSNEQSDPRPMSAHHTLQHAHVGAPHAHVGAQHAQVGAWWLHESVMSP